MIQNFYLSESGNDGNNGTEQAPMRSLSAIRDKVREYRKSIVSDSKPDIQINLGAGKYRLDETLVLEPQDGGDDGQSIIWQGPDAGDAVVTAGYPLENWQRCGDEVSDLPTEARGKVWFTELPADSRVNTFFGPRGQIPRARGKVIPPQKREPDEGETYTQYRGPDGPVKRHSRGDDGTYHNRFGFLPGAIAPAEDLNEAEFVIIPVCQWTMNILPVDRVDFDKNTVYLKRNCSYAIDFPPCAPEGSIWLENSLSVIGPGSWVYHSSTKRLYYWPKGDKPEEGLEASWLCEFIRVEGTPAPIKEGRPEEPQHKVGNIHFNNIEFTRSSRFPFHGLTGKGTQHDWEMYDAGSCMLRFRHADDCSVENCSFTQGGSGGVRADMASRHIRVTGSRFSHLGGCGIVLCGYGLSYNYFNRDHYIADNHIHNIGEHYWHCPAIFIWQSGNNTITGNYLHDLPYTGIVCSGRTVLDRDGVGECSGTICWEDLEEQCGKGYEEAPWHYSGLIAWWKREPLMHARENLIEYNRIHDVMQTLGDGNSIYVSGAGGGNVVRFNVVGPCPSPTMAEGIRTDNDQHQTIIHGNLIYAQGGMATGITLKGINKITNNILALPFTDPERGMLSLETGPLNGGEFKRNIILTSNGEQNLVHEMRIHGLGRKALLRDMDSDSNLYYCLADPEVGKAWVEEQQDFGNDTHSLYCDPGFVDAKAGNFELKENAAVLKTGFKPLPLKKMFSAGQKEK